MSDIKKLTGTYLMEQADVGISELDILDGEHLVQRLVWRVLYHMVKVIHTCAPLVKRNNIVILRV